MRILLCTIFLPILALELLLANLLQITSLLVLPFSSVIFRRINGAIAGLWFYQLALFLEFLPGLEFVISGDLLEKRENTFVICNHQSAADIPAIVVLAKKLGRTQDLKWFVKDVIKWIPGIGWGMLFLDCLYLKRNWTADKEKILATFERLRKNRSPFFLLSYVEGTRLTLKKRERSREFCRKAALPDLIHVLSPRTRGFNATVEGLAGILDAVYDVTLAFEGFPTGEVPGLGALLWGPMHRVHIHVKRHGADSLPETKEQRNQWILDRFQEKDALLAEFYRSRTLREPK